ncbi:MAG: hypothetical protein JW838_10970 [Spirochaetes bacterium]|nr:hypothetical protein [Spirochaetota bacterium]
MYRARIDERANRIENDIRKKERLALEAKAKGMHATYSNYLMEISVLKAELQKVSSGLRRAV